MGLDFSNGNPLAEAANKANRMKVMNHPFSKDVLIQRKVAPIGGVQTGGGGIGIMGMDDATEYEFENVGHGKMLGTSQLAGANWAGDWQTFNSDEGKFLNVIEPKNEGEFQVKKHDRVYVILPNFVIAYQVTRVFSPHSLPDGRAGVVELEPLEQPSNPDMNNLN